MEAEDSILSLSLILESKTVFQFSSGMTWAQFGKADTGSFIVDITDLIVSDWSVIVWLMGKNDVKLKSMT